jgi:transposase-like protein
MMELVELHCPRCGGTERQIKDGFTPAGSQRYRCKLCQARYTPEPKEQGYDEDVRLQALNLYLEGLSLRAISRLLSVNHQSIANWIHDYANHMPADLPPSILEIAILDGFYTPPKSLRKRHLQIIPDTEK